MSSAIGVPVAVRDIKVGEPAAPNHEAILEQVHRIVGSSYFRNSRRYPVFISYVVEQALRHPDNMLKERTIGVEVFHRPNDYDTATDPIVRVTAGEIRKRLAQYYQEPEHRDQLRIELPLGSYMPVFTEPSPVHREDADGDGNEQDSSLHPHPAEDNHSMSAGDALPVVMPETLIPPSRTTWRRAMNLGYLVAAAVVLLSFACFFIFRANAAKQQEAGIEYCWGAVLNTESPMLVVMGTHSLNAAGRDLSPGDIPELTSNTTMLSSMITSDMVPMSDLASFSTLVQQLAQHHRKYTLQAAHETTFEQIQKGPVLLIGAFDNPWTLRFAAKLPYTLQSGANGMDWIVDRQHPQDRWGFNNSQNAKGSSRDYAIVAGFFDPGIQQHVLIASGIGKSGTVAASEFLTNSSYIENWLRQVDTRKSNFEAVLTTEMLDSQSGPPQVLRSKTW